MFQSVQKRVPTCSECGNKLRTGHCEKHEVYYEAGHSLACPKRVDHLDCVASLPLVMPIWAAA